MHKNQLRILGLVGALVIVLLPNVAIAQGTTQTDLSAPAAILWAMSFLISVLNYVVYLIFQWLSVLLDPTLILDIGGPGQIALNNIWRVSRDIMNTIFAFMLIVGAIYTVIMAKGDIIRQYIGKFVIAVVLVNFSWFFPRVILDIANVMTASVYQLPSVLGGASTCVVPNRDYTATENCKIIVDYPRGSATCPAGTTEKKMVGDLVRVCLDDLSSNTNTAYGILNGLVVSHGRLQYIPEVTKPVTGTSIASEQGLAWMITVAFTLFAHILAIFPLIAMTVAFVVRIPILWLTIAFMPFMFLSFVLDGKPASFNTMEYIWKKFITSAFLPTMVAIPFTVGYIMLNQISQLLISPPPQALGSLTTNMTPLIGGATNVWGLMWMFVSYGVIWVGVFMALGTDSLYQSVTAPIKNVGQSWAKLPLAIPLPMPNLGGGKDADGKPVKMSLGQLGQKLANPASFFDPNAKAPTQGKPLKERISDVKGNTRVTNDFKTTITEVADKNKTIDIDKLKQLMLDNKISGRDEVVALAKELGIRDQSKLDALEKNLKAANVSK